MRRLVGVWNHSHSVPLCSAELRLTTPEQFRELRDTSINITDLLLLGLEFEAAMALTPDWTWEKYPRGLGEVAYFAADDAPAPPPLPEEAR